MFVIGKSCQKLPVQNRLKMLQLAEIFSAAMKKNSADKKKTQL